MLPFLVSRGNAPGPLVITKDGKHLTRSLLVKMVKETLTTAGIDCSRYNGTHLESEQPQRPEQKGSQKQPSKL